tara:strand:+ start:2999 stop:5866 length:2868 start_codon:yes stop_codon:yes gene_type:complete
MFKNNFFLKISLYLFITLFFGNNILLACDTTPSLIVSNVIDNGDDTFYMDISVCIGSGGSADGFDLYFNNDINIIGTTVTEITATGSGNTASVSVDNGVWLAYFEEYSINGTYFENGVWGLECIEFGIIVNSDPDGGTICGAGINEDCLGFTQNDVFITCGVIPGPCLPNHFITDNGTIDSNVSIAGQNCNFAPFNDEIVEITVTCPGDFDFSLTQDASINWPGESWLTLAVGCCSGVIEQTSSFGFLEPTISLNTYLTEGIYYIVVDIEGNGFPGDYILNIISSADLSLVTTALAGDDELTCSDSIVLNANTVAVNEIGNWTMINGSGNFTNSANPNTTVTNLSNGTNTFQWEISNACSSSTDQVVVEVANNLTFNIPDTVYCLEPIYLEAIGAGNNGEWSVEPEFNIDIEDVNSSTTIANVSAYGNYTFTYTICGDSFSTSVTVESITPILSSESNTYSCLESFSLEAQVEGDPGYWDSEGPFIANIDNVTSLNPTITVNGYGTYIFTYYGCGTSNSIEINMIGTQPNVSGPEEIYCLESFELIADVNGDPGYWDFQGPGNAIFDNQVSLTPTVTVDEYGIYEFTYYGCGIQSEPIIVNALSVQPQIIEPAIETLNIYCDLEATLESYVLADPGYWNFEGPGNVVFSNQNSENTTINVTDYGIYSFIYYGCGTQSEPIMINFEAVEPVIQVEQIISCGLTASLTGIIENDQNIEWFINNTPDSGSSASFSDPNSINTDVTVDEYGIYEIGLNGCGTTTLVEINFESVAPHIIAPNFQNCILTATLIAYTNDPNGGGPWSGSTGVIFSSPQLNVTEVTVPDFGLYNFSYEACNEVSTISIGFECPLIFPNVITPNDDNNNDLFFIQNLNQEIYSQSMLTIYNRWGTVLYSEAGYGINEKWWDGKTTYNNTQVNDGVYYYIFEVFNNVTQELEKYTGELNVFKSNSSSSNDKISQ